VWWANSFDSGDDDGNLPVFWFRLKMALRQEGRRRTDGAKPHHRSRSYFQIDPVQRLAATTTVPFGWRYDDTIESASTPICPMKRAPPANSCASMGRFQG